MRGIILLGMALLMGGCVVSDREQLFYTRAEIDAITIRMECKQMARNYLQLSRCDTWLR